MSSYSSLTYNNICNYNCPVCRKTGKLPNIAGKFFLINDTQCKCNGCNTVFDKSEYYAKPKYENDIDGPWAFPASDIERDKLGSIHEIKSPNDNSEDSETVPNAKISGREAIGDVNTYLSYPTSKIYKYFGCCS
jgi:hypothetical protein